MKTGVESLFQLRIRGMDTGVRESPPQSQILRNLNGFSRSICYTTEQEFSPMLEKETIIKDA